MTQCTRCGFLNRSGAKYCGKCAMPLTAGALLPVGSVVQQRYRVLRPLGTGGMGAVYLVEDTRVFGKHWALKELLDSLLAPADRAQAIQQFQTEARLLVRLGHPSLPQIADYFSAGSRQYLVMEYVDGETLESVLSKTAGFLPETQVHDWALQLCDVLTYLHGQNPPVIFRDLKPENAMLSHTGVIKLIDFGIARLFRPGKIKDTTLMGTPGFAAPEQYGSVQTDARSDVYSLGATLHRLLTRYDPAAGQPFSFPSCRSLNSNISPQLEAVVGKATQLDPNQRYQTAADMKAQLLSVRSIARQPALAPTVVQGTAGVVGPAPVRWLQRSPLYTFSAYCRVEQQETTWIQEHDGSCTCSECDTSYDVGEVEQVLTAPCSQCGVQTTWAISDEKCICLGCGQEWTISGVTGAIEAYCSQCGAKTPWIIGDVDGESQRLCLGCGQQR